MSPEPHKCAKVLESGTILPSQGALRLSGFGILTL